MSTFLIIDDEPSIREFLSILLRKSGYHVETAPNGPEGIKLLHQQDFDVVFTDLKMPGGMSGLEVLESVRKDFPAVQTVMMTAFATTETAIKAMKLGAYDYIQKPFKIEEVKAIASKCLEKRALLKENVYLKSELQSRYNFGNLIGKSEEMRSVFSLLQKVAGTKVSVLILGESGTGKELVAKALHYSGSRSERPFVAINCGAIPESLLESELFGHVKGAFTGAEREKKGLFQAANQGTLFLDEIGELPLLTQVKLLRVLQEQKVRPIGSTETTSIDVRIIAATNKKLNEEIEAGRFREDLYFRLNVLSVEMPPLRERKDDIPLLAQHFLKKFAKEMEREIEGFSREVMELLLSYPYKGNVRELENIIERAVLLESGHLVQPESLPKEVLGVRQLHVFKEEPVDCLPPEGLEPYIGKIEHRLLVCALKEAEGVQKSAAKLLRITPRSFRYRLAKHGIQTEQEDAE